MDQECYNLKIRSQNLTCIPDIIVAIATSAASFTEGKLHIATCALIS
jgi:hypothetical protein